jgi:sporadic carbohydrate cluster 2OG-Fe(II) oxygenase
MNLLKEEEQALTESFMTNGYVIQPAENLEALARIRHKIAQLSAEHLKVELPQDIGTFLDNIADIISPPQLNDLRLHLISGLMSTDWFRQAYYSTAQNLLETLIGNELAMQRNMGMSVLLPEDDSSIIHLHSDAWGSECSPFEVVLWVPFVDCYRTKSVFICPPEKDRDWRQKLSEFSEKGTDALFNAVEPDLIWPDVPYGRVLLFTPTVMHGGRVNKEATTRWSINVRFKGLFTPYAGKRLGEYFAPISVRGASRIGMQFEYPGGFSE